MANKPTIKVTKYPRETIVGLSKYKDNVDVVNAVLEDGKEYSLEEAEMLVDKFMKGKVK